jgi:hypothetical protein
MLASSSDDETVRLWDKDTGVCLQIFRTERPYERMNITWSTGITSTQKKTLQFLGAIAIEGDQH